MAKLLKNIGFVTYPKLGMPSPQSSVMETPKLKIPDRYAMLGLKPTVQTGAVQFTQNKNKANPVPPEKQKMTGYVNTDSKYALIGNQGHETQHTVFAKIKQRHGQDFASKLINHTLSVLSPVERKFADYINVDANKYPATDRNEELIANFHNYLQDPKVRKLVHNKRGLSDKAALNLHNVIKSAWQKIRNHAQTIDFQTINKSELSKREPPKFPKLEVPDARRQVELINDPKKLNTKLRAMAHTGARKAYEQGVWQPDPINGGSSRVPVSPETKTATQAQARSQAEQRLKESVQGTTGVAGSVQGNLGYALSGILRPSQFGPSWRGDKENESHGTKQHEEFHAQMQRIGDKFGPMARRALVSNLWNSLGDDHRHAINYLQEHWAGRSYEERNPGTAQEEKLARIFNHLNSPETRAHFHGHQFSKQHELPNGEVVTGGDYYVPGIAKLSNKEHFDNTIKDAHKTLLAAAEVANENWLQNGHIKSSEFHANPPVVVKSEAKALNHMHGFSESVRITCQAARFLSGKPIDESRFREALRQNDGDIKIAALIGHGLEPTNVNIKALTSITKIQDFSKSLFAQKYEIKAGHPEADHVAQALQAAINRGEVNKIELGGKHSAGSLLVSDENNINWIIKPESFKESPALGVHEETASQSEREAAFYHIANVLGLGHAVPQSEFIWLNEKPAAAIKMVPFDWMNLESAKREDPNIATTALEPYRQSGELFKWAILDYVFGNTDSHGANVMISTKDDGHKIVLIDHGSAFAGKDFAPGFDNNTFVPYYLRVWTHRKWSTLTPQEKLQASPRATAEKEKEVFHWLLGINPERIGAIMQRYGIDAQPSLARLAKLKSCKEPIDSYLAKVWNGLA